MNILRRCETFQVYIFFLTEEREREEILWFAARHTLINVLPAVRPPSHCLCPTPPCTCWRDNLSLLLVCFHFCLHRLLFSPVFPGVLQELPESLPVLAPVRLYSVVSWPLGLILNLTCTHLTCVSLPAIRNPQSAIRPDLTLFHPPMSQPLPSGPRPIDSFKATSCPASTA